MQCEFKKMISKKSAGGLKITIIWMKEPQNKTIAICSQEYWSALKVFIFMLYIHKDASDLTKQAEQHSGLLN